MVVYDLATGCLAAYPTKNKTAHETAKRLIHFRGKDKVKFFFSDKHASLLAAVERLGEDQKAAIPHETSVPGIHETNAIAENKVKKVIAGTRVDLLQAGLPACFWPFAAEHYAFMVTVMENEQQPAYFNRHGKYFKGPLIPFGAAIDVVPSPLAPKPKKFNPRGCPACFLATSYS